MEGFHSQDSQERMVFMEIPKKAMNDDWGYQVGKPVAMGQYPGTYII